MSFFFLVLSNLFQPRCDKFLIDVTNLENKFTKTSSISGVFIKIYPLR